MAGGGAPQAAEPRGFRLSPLRSPCLRPGRGVNAAAPSSAYPPSCLQAFVALSPQTRAKRPRPFRCLHRPLWPRKPRSALGASMLPSAAQPRPKAGEAAQGCGAGVPQALCFREPQCITELHLTSHPRLPHESSFSDCHSYRVPRVDPRKQLTGLLTKRWDLLFQPRPSNHQARREQIQLMHKWASFPSHRVSRRSRLVSACYMEVQTRTCNLSTIFDIRE